MIVGGSEAEPLAVTRGTAYQGRALVSGLGELETVLSRMSY